MTLTSEDRKERNARIAVLYKEGIPSTVLSERFHLTRERIRQILMLHGIKKQHGGAHVKAQRLHSRALELRNKWHLDRYGHDWETHKTLLLKDRQLREEGTSVNMTVVGRYRRQRANALRNGYPFTLTLAEWWKIWQASGKWEMSGRGHGRYAMVRLDTRKGYEPGNVAIMEFSALTRRKGRNKQMWVRPVDRGMHEATGSR